MTTVYYKAPPTDPVDQYRQYNRKKLFLSFKNLIPTIMITVGASLLISVGYPIISYELTTARQYKRDRIITPIPKESVFQAKGTINPTIAQNPQVLAETTTNIPSSTVDYSKVNNWFNFNKPQSLLSPSNITHYTISIPKLRISDALVTVGGDDLNTSLIHYGGTAYPGESGNPVIFGHSVLPQFYNPNSYRSIFSLLPTLKPGDQIKISFDGISYQYIVYDYYEVSPDEVDILEQRYNQKDLTLVTCTPPGTYWRRGIIKAKLQQI
jgi:sortase A